MCAIGDEKVYEFSVSIESGRYHMVGVAPEAFCEVVNTYHSSTALCSPQVVGTGMGLRRTRNGGGALGVEFHRPGLPL